MIARLEITKADGSVETIVSDRSWKTALGPTVYDMWSSGSDYDSRREQPGWTDPRAGLSETATRRDGSPVGRMSAGIAPPPNLTTELVWRAGEPVEAVDRIRPVSITQPKPGVWVFDFGQNFAGWPRLEVDGSVPAGTTIKMQPAESLAPDGTVHQGSIMGGGGRRGTDIFATYTTHGDRRGETWHPQFNYFYTAYLRTMQRHLAEGQSKEGENIGNVALKAPVYDWGYLGRFGDEINWGNGIVLVPWLAYETYGDTRTMERYYTQMQAFMDYIAREKADGFIVDAALADWAAADTTTSGRITGTWGYYQSADRMAKMADLLGHEDDAAEYRDLAANVRAAFNAAFYNCELGRYTARATVARRVRRRLPKRWRWTRGWFRKASAGGSSTRWSS